MICLLFNNQIQFDLIIFITNVYYIDTVFVNVSTPLATFDTILDPGCDGVVAEYTNTSNNEFDFVWNFSDGDSSNLAEVEKVFDFGSSFSATLTVQDSLSCTNSITINGNADTFENYFDIYYPNVFTPNGDGENDQFIIEVPGRIYECTELIIYNRWGQVQFISTGNNLRWDGRNSVGGELPMVLTSLPLTSKMVSLAKVVHSINLNKTLKELNFN